MKCKSDCVFNIDGKCTRQSKKDITVTEKWKNDFKGFISRLSMPEDDFYGIMQYIDEVPNEERWIPVSEDLPEYTINDKVSEDVLVFDGTDIRVGEYRKGIHLHGAGYWRVFGYEIDEHVDVIAWMPLPEPYEPQERSEE